jgi:hypothetical protein
MSNVSRLMPFSPPNLKSYVCSHVFSKARPILLVVHEGGDWSFLCGDNDHTSDGYRVVGVGHLVERDATIDECADLPPEFEAERTAIGQPWLRCPVEATQGPGT